VPGLRKKGLAGLTLAALLLLTASGVPAAPVILHAGTAAIEVTIDPGLDLPEARLTAWISRSAEAVRHYFGEFPVKHVRLHVFAGEGRRGVSNGTTFGENGAHIRITVGEHSTQRDLDKDWMMTHEFVHLAFPDQPRRHHWIEEGLATYVEPIARAQIGDLAPAQVWGSFVRDLPQGEPEDGDRGLDNTHTWGRTYWGGALFCFVADVTIRRATGNRQGLQDALRGVLKKGGNIETDWPLEKVLAVADESAGTHVLTTLYNQMKDSPAPIDLAGFWARLGVRGPASGVTFDDAAPEARVRKAILGQK